MGRDATKASGNPYYKARINASKYNDKLRSREGAAELLGMSVSSLADAELGLYKFMPVDKVVIMAETYGAPWLLNHYCLNECPIGECHPISDEVPDIDRITVKLVRGLKLSDIENVKDKLLDIAADGVISEDETDELSEIVDFFDSLIKDLSELKLAAQVVLKGGLDHVIESR